MIGLSPEVRYSVYYADNRGLRRSRLLHVGEYMPMEEKTGETKRTIRTPNDQLDHVFAVVDPADDQMGDAVRERVRLSRARACDDEQCSRVEKRRSSVLGGAALLRI